MNKILLFIKVNTIFLIIVFLYNNIPKIINFYFFNKETKLKSKNNLNHKFEVIL